MGEQQATAPRARVAGGTIGRYSTAMQRILSRFTLLFLTLIVSALSLSTGRTTIQQGAVHLVILGAYPFTTIVP